MRHLALRRASTAVSTGLMAVGLLFSLSGSAEQIAPERVLQWREDLEFMVKGLSASGTAIDFTRGISSRGQKDFGKLYPKESFDPEIAALKEAVPELSDSEVVLRIMRIIASANVAHNTVTAPAMGFPARLPVTLQWFADGLAITAIAPAYREALGARIVKIGTLTPEQLTAKVAPYISHENDQWLHLAAAQFIRSRAVLEHFELTDSQGAVALTLEKPGSPMFIQTVAIAAPNTQQVRLSEALPIPAPISRLRAGQNYWQQYLPESGTVYVQYNSCANDPKLPFAAFARAVMADVDAQKAKRFVIDLRYNGGGDSRIVGPY